MSIDEKLMKILISPCVSEKATRIQADRQYVFKVIKSANKIDIKKAVQKLFNVNVTAVQICNTKDKSKKFGKIEGIRKGWKKAYVTLKEGQAINLESGG